MGTQWRYLPDGRPQGLRYEALPAVLELIGVESGERQAVFAGLCLMEREALDVMTAS